MTFKRNTSLKAAIFESGMSQAEVAKRAGIHPTVLSRVINGRMNLDDSERQAVAGVVGKPVREVFFSQ